MSEATERKRHSAEKRTSKLVENNSKKGCGKGEDEGKEPDSRIAAE